MRFIALAAAAMSSLAAQNQNPLSGISLIQNKGSASLSVPMQIIVMLTVLTVLPAIIMSITPFLRITVVLHFLRQALGTQTTPSNQVLIGLALFLTLLIMQPVVMDIYHQGWEPFESGQLGWQQAFDNGATTGQRGPEGGVIVRDEEHKSGARATLERDCGSAPWTVTCGVYGWFFHTRFLGSEEAAEFHSMLNGLAAILDHIPSADDPEADSKVSVVCEAIERFVARFP